MPLISHFLCAVNTPAITVAQKPGDNMWCGKVPSTEGITQHNTTYTQTPHLIYTVCILKAPSL